MLRTDKNKFIKILATFSLIEEFKMNIFFEKSPDK
jgi:hypothetical protein